MFTETKIGRKEVKDQFGIEWWKDERLEQFTNRYLPMTRLIKFNTPEGRELLENTVETGVEVDS